MGRPAFCHDCACARAAGAPVSRQSPIISNRVQRSLRSVWGSSDASPAASTEWKGVGVSITDADVRAQLPSLLRYAAFDAELAPEALAMLWELGRDDKREPQ